jgi:uncharacterized protein (DUF885 family)
LTDDHGQDHDQQQQGDHESGEGDSEAGRRLAERFWDGLLEIEPTIGTQLGDDRYDDRLPDPTDAGRERAREFFEEMLTDLGQLDRGRMGLETRSALDVLEAGATRMLDDVRYRLDRFQAVTHLWGPGSFITDLGQMQRGDSPERRDKWLNRLRAFPAYLDAIGDIAREGVETGQVAPGLVVDRAIAQLERLLELDPADTPAVAPVPEEDTEGRNLVLSALRDHVWPGYRRYLEVLREYRPRARDTIGLSALPNGEEIYASQIKAFTTLPLTPQRVHEIGVEDLAKIQEERAEIAGRLGFTGAVEALAAYEADGKNRASSRQEMIALAEDQVRRSWEAAPQYFGRLPGANCEVRPVPEFQEGDVPGAYYFPPSVDGHRSGIYFINTGGLEHRPLHHVATTTYHEANPGHHFQISLEHEFTERLPLRRFGGILAGSAFIEGWGLYSERLADEMGLYLDEYERLGMLDAQGWRAARCIVDSGIHVLGWDRERAVQQVVEAGIPRHDAEIEVDRYIAVPGQACAYKVGQLEIQRWREERAARDGTGFSLKDFHDRLLALGSLPLEALDRELSRG